MDTATSTKDDYKLALRILRPFGKKDIGKANLQFFMTFVSLHGLLVLSYTLYDTSPLISVFIIPFITVFMCRSYVIEHDCGHQSFYRKTWVNTLVGNILAFLIMIPYSMWKYIHDSHHNNVGNLDKRHLNPELWTLTVNEYREASRFKKLSYRFIRSKFCQFALSPFTVFFILFRLPNSRFDTTSNISVLVYDLLYLSLFWFFFKEVAFIKLTVVYFLPLFLFANIASYVFYAQHQFENTYWEKESEWTYEEATFKGSTYLIAPKWFNWLSGNVVYHNIHHLISTIPNYNLEEAQRKLGDSLGFTPISLFKVYQLVDYKLWDENMKKMVGFNSIN